MKEIQINELAYWIKTAQKKPIFFLGAGASKTGNIPLAPEMALSIQADYAENPFIKKLKKEERTYSKLMDCLMASQRNELLKKIIEDAKINVTHIYLAQLLKEGYADYILTVNFDNLMLKALALYNIFPPTYDMAILKDLTTTTFKEKSVVYLHGQHHGLWLLNTPEEMDKVRATVPRIFDTIKNGRPWVFIGYSGSDPIFEHIKGLGRFDDGIFWIGYNDHKLNESVEDFLKTPNTNAFYVKGYDSDAFMLKLNEALHLPQPVILDKPFTSLNAMLNDITDINDEEHFKGVKERLEIAKRNTTKAISQFEEYEAINIDNNELKVDKLKKQLIDLIIKQQFKEEEIEAIEQDVRLLNEPTTNDLLAGLFNDWGIILGDSAKNQKEGKAKKLYIQAFQKYSKAIEIKPDYHITFYNWGSDLGNLARTKKGKEAEELYLQAFEKFQKAIELKSDYFEAYNNWGNQLGDLAETKTGEEAKALYEQAFKKFAKAIEIKPDNDNAFYNWGSNLGKLAQIADKNEETEIYEQAFEKLSKAIEIKPDEEAFNNWGTFLANLADTKEGEEADRLYQQAFEKYARAIELKPESETFNNWGTSLGNLAKNKEGKEAETIYQQAFEKYNKAIEIAPDNYQVLLNWGSELGNIAQIKEGEEAEKIYLQAFEKYGKALEIKSDDYRLFYNWGIDLGNFANIKKGTDAEKIYFQAFEKFNNAIQINPDNHEVYNDWGIYLGDYAQLKEGVDAQDIYRQAFEKYSKAVEMKTDYYDALYNWASDLVELAKKEIHDNQQYIYIEAIDKFLKAFEFGGRCYNLACLYATINQPNEALMYLDVSLSNNEVPVSFVLEDEDWKTLKEGKEFKSITDKYKTQ